MSVRLDNCAQVMKWLSDYLDDDLGAESALRVERHLRECNPCLGYVDGLRRIIELCRGYEPAVKPRPLSPSAKAELESAWQEALAKRRHASNRESL